MAQATPSNPRGVDLLRMHRPCRFNTKFQHRLLRISGFPPQAEMNLTPNLGGFVPDSSTVTLPFTYPPKPPAVN
jgi:hypothetical protein